MNVMSGASHDITEKYGYPVNSTESPWHDFKTGLTNSMDK